MVYINCNYTATCGEDFEILVFPRYSQQDGLTFQRTIFESDDRISRKAVRQKFFGRRDGLALRVSTENLTYEVFKKYSAGSPNLLGIAWRKGFKDIFWRNRVDMLSRSRYSEDGYFEEWFEGSDVGKFYQRAHFTHHAITDAPIGELFADRIDIATQDFCSGCPNRRIEYDVLEKSLLLLDPITSKRVFGSELENECARALVYYSCAEINKHFLECMKI